MRSHLSHRYAHSLLLRISLETNHSRRPGALHRVSGAGTCHRRWRHRILAAMGRSPARVTPDYALQGWWSDPETGQR